MVIDDTVHAANFATCKTRSDQFGDESHQLAGEPLAVHGFEDRPTLLQAAADPKEDDSAQAKHGGGSLPRLKPLEPADALKTFKLQHGFQLDLLAAEPLTTDPVAIEYDADGRAYVVEMCDYPYTDKSTDKPFVERTTDLPLGRVRILEDIDGDSP